MDIQFQATKYMSLPNRTVSEYTENTQSSSLTNKFKLEQNFTTEENSRARGKIYGLLFADNLAKLAVLPSILTGATPIFGFIIFGTILGVLKDNQNGLDSDEAMKKVYFLEIYMGVMTVVTSIARFFDADLWSRVGARISIRIRDEIFSRIMSYDVTFFDTNPIGNLLTILGEDSAVIQECFGSTKGSQFQNFGQCLASLIAVFTYNWQIGLIMLAMVPFVIIMMALFRNSIDKNGKIRFRHIASSMTIAEETLAAIRTVRGFNREEKDITRFYSANELGSNFEKKVVHLTNAMFSTVMAVMWALVLGTLYYGATLVRDGTGNLQSTELFSIFGFTLLGTFSLIMLQNSLQAEQRAITAGARIMRLLAHVPLVPFEGGEEFEDIKGHIKFENVYFMYPTRNVNSLDGVSFEVPPGTMAALVGHSGSGKSTYVQLLERFYDVTDGAITIDGHNIKDINPRWLHRKMALVSQEPTLFQMSIRDNVLYGVDKDKSDEEVWKALEDANAKKFVSKMEKGLDTLAGDRGNNLSGGQRQRVAIARAVIKDPVIMIADEATSALDAASEVKVQQALDRILKDRTSIIVAHRLSTIRNATKIFVFDSGKIVESGNHQELVKMKKSYYQLVKRQLPLNERDDASSDEDGVGGDKKSSRSIAQGKKEEKKKDEKKKKEEKKKDTKKEGKK